MANLGPTPISMCSCPDPTQGIVNGSENDLKSLVILVIVNKAPSTHSANTPITPSTHSTNPPIHPYPPP